VAGALAWWLPRLPLADGDRWGLNLLALIVFAVVAVALGLIRINEVQQAKALVISWLFTNMPKSSS